MLSWFTIDMVRSFLEYMREIYPLATHDENLICSIPNDSITFHNDHVMEIGQPGINTPTYRPSLLFIEEEHKSLFNFINLEEEYQMPHIKSID